MIFSIALVLENFPCLNLQIMQHEKHFFLRSTVQHFNYVCACEEADECPERQMFPALLLQHTMAFDHLDTSPPKDSST
jgi:hypothetical protein